MKLPVKVTDVATYYVKTLLLYFYISPGPYMLVQGHMWTGVHSEQKTLCLCGRLFIIQTVQIVMVSSCKGPYPHRAPSEQRPIFVWEDLMSVLFVQRRLCLRRGLSVQRPLTFNLYIRAPIIQ